MAGWRKTFKDILIDKLKAIEGIKTVESEFKNDPTNGYPALTIGLISETYERTFGGSIGVEEMSFEIMGRVTDIEEIDDALESLLDSVIEKLEEITVYDTDGALLVEETIFHERTESGEKAFTLSGKLPILKDYSSM